MKGDEGNLVPLPLPRRNFLLASNGNACNAGYVGTYFLISLRTAREGEGNENCSVVARRRWTKEYFLGTEKSLRTQNQTACPARINSAYTTMIL